MSSEHERLAGWGRTAATYADVFRPSDESAAMGLVGSSLPGRAVGFRGLGRSYGDAAQSAGGSVIETTRMTAVLEFDTKEGIVRAEAGVSIDSLLRQVVPQGWFVPVTPGTRMVTLGGAAAADVHGKNHHRDGSIGAHIIGLKLVTVDGSIHDLRPGEQLFEATIGGMGLTGLILEVTLRLIPITSAYLHVETTRASGLYELMAKLEEHDRRSHYSVAWIDCLSRGRALGRGVVTSGEHADAHDLDGRAARSPLAFDPRVRLRAPAAVPTGLLNRASVKAFNEAWFRRAPARPRTTVEHATTFFHPLDGIAEWNRIYGSAGFIQYQYVVPFGAEDTVARTVRLLSEAGAASFLAVLKRFGAEGSGLLSFPMPGWTLALDIPARPGLASLLMQLDRLVDSAGGRLYLAKDARMPRSLLVSGYPRLEAFREVRHRVDPMGRIATDLSRRLGL